MPDFPRDASMTESRFCMWRTVFAMAHADNVVTKEEVKFLQGVLARESFTEEQRKILEADIGLARNIPDMFAKISDQEDRSQFFYHARLLVWCDGDFGEQEQQIITRLNQAHIRTVDFAQILQHSTLQLDDSVKGEMAARREEIISFDKPKGLVGRTIDRITGKK